MLYQAVGIWSSERRYLMVSIRGTRESSGFGLRLLLSLIPRSGRYVIAPAPIAQNLEQELGIGLICSKFRVLRSKFRVPRSKFRVLRSKFRVPRSKFRVLRLKFRVLRSN